MIPAALVGTGLVLAVLSNAGPRNNTSVQSSIDGNTYQVQNLPNRVEAANKLAGLRQRLTKLVEMYKNDPASISDPRISILVSRFNPNNFCENDINADTTSYSENKGEKIVVCIREKSPPYNFVDDNTIMFVLLHEMAHLMTTTIGHTPEFWANFKRILHDGVRCGIYTAVNYSKHPTPYCGMVVSDSPI